MTENDNPNLSFDNLPRTVAELHTKIDRLTAMLERFISSADTKSLPEIMTVEDVSTMLCKSVSTIYAMTSEHRIPYRKQGNKLLFPTSGNKRMAFGFNRAERRTEAQTQAARQRKY